jgi:hypothetical protein
MYNSDHTATEKNFLLPPQSVDVLSRFIYTALCLGYTFTAATLVYDQVTSKVVSNILGDI